MYAQKIRHFSCSIHKAFYKNELIPQWRKFNRTVNTHMFALGWL